MSWFCPDCDEAHAVQYVEPTKCRACVVAEEMEGVKEANAVLREEVERLRERTRWMLVSNPIPSCRHCGRTSQDCVVFRRSWGFICAECEEEGSEK